MLNFLGKVINQKNLPIKGAKVSFEGLGTPRVVYTDGEGVFLFPVNIISGNTINVKVRVEAEGYELYDRNIDLSINNLHLEEIRLIENKIDKWGKLPIPVIVTIITVLGTIIVALISSGAFNGKTPTPQSTSQPSKVSTDTTPNINQKPRKRIEIEVSDSNTQQLLSDVYVELRPSTGQTVPGKTNKYGYLNTSVLEQNENLLEVHLSKDNYEPSSEYIDISIQKKHPLSLKKKGITRTSFNQNSLSTGTSDSNTPTPISSYKAPLINGYWNIKMKVTDDTNFLKINRLTMENIFWRAKFEQENNQFKGYIEDANGRACLGKGEASISGSVKGRKVDWKVEFPSKCCHGGEMFFEGDLVDTGKIEGNIKPNPESVSKEKCTLFWAEVDMQPSGS